MLIQIPPTPPPEVTTRYGNVKFSCWLRGVEVAVRGYIEPADRSVGIWSPSLVIEDLVPLGDAPHWKCPDIDDLLDTGEYEGISEAFWRTHDLASDYEYYCYWGYSDDSEISHSTKLWSMHVKWLNHWLKG